MPVTKSAKDLVAEANAKVRTIPVEEAKAMLGRDDVMFVDIRDIRELEATGQVPGAQHAPRGMLEFWFAPDSPYYREAFGDAGKTYVLYCASAGRSALATADLMALGLDNVAHMAGGFTAWKHAGGEVATKAARPEKKA